jgi:hypothetical protein
LFCPVSGKEQVENEGNSETETDKAGREKTKGSV